MSIGRQLVVLGSGNRVVATRPACQCEQRQFIGQASGHSIKGKWALDKRRCMLRSSTLRCSTQGISINPRYTNGLLHVDIWFIDYASYENSIGIGRQAPVGSRLLASVRHLSVGVGKLRARAVWHSGSRASAKQRPEPRKGTMEWIQRLRGSTRRRIDAMDNICALLSISCTLSVMITNGVMLGCHASYPPFVALDES